MKKILTTTLAAASLLLLSTPAFAATYYVPDHYGTIQSALNGAASGDTIIVRDGTYTGTSNKNLDFKGKALTLQSENGPENCVIDCQGSGRGFYFHSDETSESILDGFTITNAYAAGLYPDNLGGGIYCDSSSPTITNCIIRGNSADRSGGGIGCYKAAPSITNCTIIDNSAAESAGAIHCYSSSNPNIENCVISGNTAGTHGGGIVCGASSPTINACTITGNSSAQSGGGIYCISSSAMITNCIIAENAGSYGGGIQCGSSSSSLIINHCTVTGNSATNYGGGINITGATPIITNCVLWSDSAPQGSELSLFAGSVLSIDYNDVGGGLDACYVQTGCTLDLGPNTIDADPLFAGAGDYHLASGSPCIDAGTELGVYEDIDGDIRPQGAGFDIGAYEYLSPCEYSIVPTGESFEAEGGLGSIAVYSPFGCNWTAASDADWIIITSGDEGSGNGTVNYSVSANASTAAREGTITVAGLIFTINQAGLPYAVSLDIVPNSTAIFRGGKLRYTVAAANLTDSPVTFQYWTTVNLPNGSVYPPSGTLFGPVTVTLGAFESRPPTELTHAIPWSAPSGTYTYNAYIGTYPSAVINEDHFDFTVR